MKIKMNAFWLLLLCSFSIATPIFAQQEYCRFKKYGDCSEEKNIRVKSKDLDSFLYILEETDSWELRHLFVHGDVTASKNIDKLADVPLKSLVLRKGRLEEVPSWVFQISSLEVLDLGDNYLSQLPSGICALENLKELNLWVNDLHKLPFCVNEMATLKRIDMTGIKLNADNQRNLSNSFRAIKFFFSEPCLCNFGTEE